MLRQREVLDRDETGMVFNVKTYNKLDIYTLQSRLFFVLLAVW